MPLQITSLFNHNHNVSLPVAALRTGFALATVWNYLRKELKCFPNKLRMTLRYLKIMRKRDCNPLEIVTNSTEIVLYTCFELFSTMNNFFRCQEGSIRKTVRYGVQNARKKHVKPKDTPHWLYSGAPCPIAKQQALNFLKTNP